MFVTDFIDMIPAVCDERLKDWNIALIVTGAIVFITGVVIAVILALQLYMKIKNSDGRCPSI